MKQRLFETVAVSLISIAGYCYITSMISTFSMQMKNAQQSRAFLGPTFKNAVEKMTPSSDKNNEKKKGDMGGNKESFEKGKNKAEEMMEKGKNKTEEMMEKGKKKTKEMMEKGKKSEAGKKGKGKFNEGIEKIKGKGKAEELEKVDEQPEMSEE